MNPNDHRFTGADVARIADLDPTTVQDWARRGLVPVKKRGLYTKTDALRFAAVRSLTGHGVPVYRAAEMFQQIEGTQGEEWRKALDKCAAGEPHVFVYVAFFSSQAFGTFLYAGSSAETDAFILDSLADGTAGERVPEDGTMPYPIAEDVPRYRVARYDIGPDLRRAFMELA